MALNIVFMGTPDFAVPCLSRLLRDGHNVSAVFSQPDRPKGRGMSLTPPPVKVLATEHGIPVHQPTKLRDGSAACLLRSLSPDLIVVVAYGRILPYDILNIPPLGCVNVHASLLPKYRGAAPIQWSIIYGERETGVTTMYMSEGLDEGDIILARQTPIGKEETSGELFNRLAEMGASLLGETVPLLEAGTAPRAPQNHAGATFAPPIEKSMARLDFSAEPEVFCNLVRGLNPSPGAVCDFGGKPLKVLRAAVVPGTGGQPGSILTPSGLVVGCGAGAVELLTVQPQGKKPMDGAAWRNGQRDLAENKFS